MKPGANPPKADDQTTTHPIAEPVAEPAPPMDGKKPVAAGDKEVENFMVATDTGGGD